MVVYQLQQHGSANVLSAHRAIQTKNILVYVNINVMTPWPVISPDLNPMERLWDVIDHHDRILRRQPKTLSDLEQELILAWNAIPEAQI